MFYVAQFACKGVPFFNQYAQYSYQMKAENILNLNLTSEYMIFGHHIQSSIDWDEIINPISQTVITLNTQNVEKYEP